MNKKKIFIIINIIIGLVILGIISYTIVDFYWDHECYITTDAEWFNKNNCIRYYR